MKAIVRILAVFVWIASASAQQPPVAVGQPPVAVGQSPGAGEPVALVSLGHRAFVIQPLQGPTILLDPFPDIGYDIAPLRAGFDVVCLSRREADSILPRGEFQEFDLLAPDTVVPGAVRAQAWFPVRSRVLAAEGVYDSGSVKITVVATSASDGPLGPRPTGNRAFVIEVNGVRIVHLGGLAHRLTDAQRAVVGRPDVLLIPVGGGEVIDGKTAAEIVKELAPSQFVVPMHHATGRLSPDIVAPAAVDEFLKAVGLSMPTVKLPGQMMLVRSRGQSGGLPPRILLPAEAAFELDAERTKLFEPLRLTRLSVLAKVFAAPTHRLDRRNLYHELPPRFHIESMIARDLQEMTRLCAEVLPGSVEPIDWGPTTGSVKYKSANPGADGAALAEMAVRVGGWIEELAANVPYYPPVDLPPAEAIPVPTKDASKDKAEPKDKASEKPKEQKKAVAKDEPPIGVPRKPAIGPGGTLDGVIGGLEWRWRHHGQRVTDLLAESEAAERVALDLELAKAKAKGKGKKKAALEAKEKAEFEKAVEKPGAVERPGADKKP